MEEKINEIHTLIKAIYPEAVKVNIFVNREGIEVQPEYRTNANGYTMQTITGKWINRVNYDN